MNKFNIIMTLVFSVVLMISLIGILALVIYKKYWLAIPFIVICFAVCESVREEAIREIYKNFGGNKDVQKQDIRRED